MNFDFSSIRTYLINKFYDLTGSTKKLFRVGEYATFLDLISYALEMFAIYVETLVREASWRNAVKRSSLNRMSFELGYTSHRKYGGQSSIAISVDPTFNSSVGVTYAGLNVAFNKWQVITDPNGVYSYYITEGGNYISNTIAKTKNINVSSTAQNLGSGIVGIPITSHGFTVGQQIYIVNTINYNGTWVIASVPDVNTIGITTNFFSEQFSSGATATSGLLVLTIAEGVPKEYFYTATGVAGESFKILNPDIDNNFIEAYIVDANRNILSTIEILDTLHFEDDLVTYKCELTNAYDFSYIKIKFGDGIKTRKLVLGEYVLIKFATTLGAEGGIDAANTLTKFKNPVLDIIGNTVTNLYCTNSESIPAGKGYEDIEDIRYNARIAHNISDNITVGNKWEFVLNNHPLVLKSKVWTDYDIGLLSTNNQIVHLAIIGVNGSIISSEDQITIGFYLKEKKSISEIIKFEALQLVHSRFYISGGVINNTIIAVQSTIFNILYANFNVKYRNFSENIYSLQASSLINENVVSDLLYYTFEIKHAEKSEIYSDLTATTVSRAIAVSKTTGTVDTQVLLQDGQVEVWLKRKISGVVQPEIRVAYPNPLNTAVLIGDNGYTITGGTVTYATNLVSFAIQDIVNDVTHTIYGVLNPNDGQALGYWIRLVYKTKNGSNEFLNDIRLPGKFNITSMESDDVIFNLHYEV